MNNLHNQIYKAVNRGISEAFNVNIDNDKNDINYQHSRISNSLNALEKYVSNILAGNDILNNYNMIMEYHSNNNIMYKPKDLSIITSLCKKIKDVVNHFDLSWMDCTDIVMIIMKDGSEMPLHLINNDNYKNGAYIKLVNDVCGHDIILSANIKRQSNFWNKNIINQEDFNDSECITDVNDALKDYNGYEHTYNNINISNDYSNYPIIKYCIENSDNVYKAYIPALGELSFLQNNVILISYILNILHTYSELSFGCQSSTEYKSYGSYILDASMFLSDFTGKVALKVKKHDFIPLFRKYMMNK